MMDSFTHKKAHTATSSTLQKSSNGYDERQVLVLVSPEVLNASLSGTRWQRSNVY